MLFFYEIKKLIKNKAVAASMLVLLAVIAVTAVRGAANVKSAVIDADEAREAYTEFALDTENASKTVLSRTNGRYGVEYYTEVIEKYSSARERIAFESGDVSGWDELLCFNVPFFAGLFVAVLLGAAAFYEDKRIGMASIITAAKRGRQAVGLCRLLAAMLLCLLFTIGSAGVSYLCFRILGGLENGGFILQSASSFFRSAEELTLLDAFILLTLRRCLMLAAVTACTCLAAKLLNGYIPILLVSAAFPVVEFALFSVRYHAVDVFVKNANVFAYGTGYLLERFYSVRFFGAAHPESLVTVAALALLALFSALAVLLPERRREGAKKLLCLPASIRLPHIKARPHGLFVWEFVKLLRTPAVLIPVCLCIALGVFDILGNAPVKQTTSEALYRTYCEGYAGLSIDELTERISEDQNRINAARARIDEADRLYMEQKISDAEYIEIFQEYISSLTGEGLMPAFKAKLNYLTDTSSELGRDMELIYDTGLNKLIGAERIILPMLAAALLACCPFIKERESGFIALLRTGKKGRGRVYLTRLAFVLITACAVTVVCSAAELYALSGDGIFDSLSVPAASLEALRAMGTTPIGLYLIEAYAMRILAAVCIALITYALSALFESPFAVLAPAVGWLLVSFALRRLGVFFLPADLSAFVSGHAAFVKAGQGAWLSMLPLIAVTAFGTAYSYRRFTRTVK